MRSWARRRTAASARNTCASSSAAWAIRRMNWASWSLEATGSLFAPASLLNQMRREAVERLQAVQAQPRAARPFAIRKTCCEPRTLRRREAAGRAPAQLHLLVRTPEQLEAAIELRPASITLDYLDLYGLRPSVERVKASGIAARVASPRILKPGEARIVDFLLSLDCAILVRSTGLLQALREKSHAELIGDFSLNAANSLTAADPDGAGPRPSDAHARSERRAGGRSGARCRSEPDRSHRLSASARFSHGTLRLLPVSCRPGRATRTADGLARSIASRCGIRAGARIR